MNHTLIIYMAYSNYKPGSGIFTILIYVAGKRLVTCPVSGPSLSYYKKCYSIIRGVLGCLSLQGLRRPW